MAQLGKICEKLIKAMEYRLILFVLFFTILITQATARQIEDKQELLHFSLEKWVNVAVTPTKSPHRWTIPSVVLVCSSVNPDERQA
jgi:hypothetical protein